MSKDGGSAFPEVFTDNRAGGKPDTYSAGGMSLRDYFAAHANIEWAHAKAVAITIFGERLVTTEQVLEARAALALGYADAMLKAREQ